MVKANNTRAVTLRNQNRLRNENGEEKKWEMGRGRWGGAEGCVCVCVCVCGGGGGGGGVVS